jgi:hypothetical protein
VKYSVDARRAVDAKWWLEPASPGGRSILQRFWDSWQKLKRSDESPKMGLYTNRPLDVSDPVLACRSGRTGTLTEALRQAKPGSLVGRGRQAWAEHIDVSEDDLLTMLDHIVVLTDQGPWTALLQSTADRMAALGLRVDAEAIERGVAAVRGWVVEGRRHIDRDKIAREIDRRELRTGTRLATLLIQAIDRDPWPDAASAASANLDWVDRYEGDEPRTRRQLKQPADWNERLRPELMAAVRLIEQQQFTHVSVRGAMRLPTWFAAGVELAINRGFRVHCGRPDQPWSSTVDPVTYRLIHQETAISQGDDLAVSLSVSADARENVTEYLRREQVQVALHVDLTPERGAGITAINGAQEAFGWAIATRDIVRSLAVKWRPPKVHLFIVGPAGCALLLGHLWLHVPPTQVYEDVGMIHAPAFFIPA